MTRLNQLLGATALCLGITGGVVLSVGCGESELPTALTKKADGRVVFQDVSVFIGDEMFPLLEHQNVTTNGQKIIDISPFVSGQTIADATVINGAGHTLLPGLIDVHTHLVSTPAPPWKMAVPDPALNAQKFLYAGITTIFDLGGQLEALQELKASINAEKFLGPDLYYSGPHLAMKDGHPQALLDTMAPWPINRLLRSHFTFAVETLEDVDEAVTEIKAGGASLVKVTVDEIPLERPYLNEEMLKRAVDRAHAVGLKVIAHVGTDEHVNMCLDAGVDLFAHGAYRDQLKPETAARLVAMNRPMAPTIGVFHAIDKLAHEGAEIVPLQAELMEPELFQAVQAKPADWSIEEINSWLASMHAHRGTQFTNVAAMKNAGVHLMVGSDSPTISWEAGASLHKEMEHLVTAGYSPAQVLSAATAGNAKAMGLEDRGHVEVGKRADLVLVKGDPTRDISAVTDLVEVMSNGVLLQRSLPYQP